MRVKTGAENGDHPRAWGEGSALPLSCFPTVSDDEMVWGGAGGGPSPDAALGRLRDPGLPLQVAPMLSSPLERQSPRQPSILREGETCPTVLGRERSCASRGLSLFWRLKAA